MTQRQIYEALMDAGIENAEFEATLLISFFCKKTRAEILASPDTDYQSKELFDAIDRRCERYPLQYIFGEWYFFGETYTVNENCLIPRSDTELLVEYAVKHLPRGARFVDLCTGSGCIAVSTLVHRPDTSAVGLELFKETAELAAHNAKRNRADDRFEVVCADLLGANPFSDAEFDAIISNPPYIRTAVVDTLDEELFSEPRAALDGGEDGLVFYKKILSDYTSSLKDGGFILFEIGYDQEDDVKSLAELYGFGCEVQKDLSGNPRMAILRK
jgi:release factor glutamine methyltransferase